jgi:hypothetical protein
MKMKTKLLLSIGFASALALAPLGSALAESSEVTETTTRSYSGTISEVTPGSTIVVRSSADQAPQTYTFTKRTVVVDPAGNVVHSELMRGQPVTVSYEREGDQLVVTKVMLSKPTTETTTTTTEQRELR